MPYSQNLQLILKRKYARKIRGQKTRWGLFMVSFFMITGLLAASLLPYELHFSRLSGKGEVIDTNIPTTDMVLVAPAAAQGSLPLSEGMGDRYVIVSLADQKMEAFEAGQRVFEAIVSTGHATRPTPKGTFTIKNKHPRAYSRVAALWMPYWMAFHHDGQYWLGFHELPEWADGTKEGEEFLGQARSGGCIRLGVGAAEQFYNWAQVGDKVMVY